jgi:hypothetical protein
MERFEGQRGGRNRRIEGHRCGANINSMAHSSDFSVFFATSIKARSFGAREARRR